MAGVYYCAASYSVTEQLGASVSVETYGKCKGSHFGALDWHKFIFFFFKVWDLVF